MRKYANPVRLYRFFNVEVGRYGEPFSMCDRCKKDYRAPDRCLMETMADKSRVACTMCGSARGEVTGQKESKV